MKTQNIKKIFSDKMMRYLIEIRTNNTYKGKIK